MSLECVLPLGNAVDQATSLSRSGPNGLNLFPLPEPLLLHYKRVVTSHALPGSLNGDSATFSAPIASHGKRPPLA